MVRAFSAAALAWGGEQDREPVVLEIPEAMSQAADLSMVRFMASVPPLEMPLWVSK
jgi:hypothetical protein